jgi:hypothetical protein
MPFKASQTRKVNHASVTEPATIAMITNVVREDLGRFGLGLIPKSKLELGVAPSGWALLQSELREPSCLAEAVVIFVLACDLHPDHDGEGGYHRTVDHRDRREGQPRGCILSQQSRRSRCAVVMPEGYLMTISKAVPACTGVSLAIEQDDAGSLATVILVKSDNHVRRSGAPRSWSPCRRHRLTFPARL